MLFRIEQEETLQPDDLVRSTLHSSQVGFVHGNSLKAIEKCFGGIDPGHSLDFATGGKWSMHELVLYFAQKLENTKLYITTWAISEDPVRALVSAKEQGLFTSIKALFDIRIKNNQGAAFHLFTSHCQAYRLTKIHAKVAVLLGEKEGVAILGSANLTTNKRIETGTVHFRRESAETHADWIETEIEHGLMIGKNERKKAY